MGNTKREKMADGDCVFFPVLPSTLSPLKMALFYSLGGRGWQWQQQQQHEDMPTTMFQSSDFSISNWEKSTTL